MLLLLYTVSQPVGCLQQHWHQGQLNTVAAESRIKYVIVSGFFVGPKLVLFFIIINIFDLTCKEFLNEKCEVTRRNQDE